MSNKFNITKEDLEKFVSNGDTAKSIADKYGCSQQTVYYLLKKFGLKTLCSDRKFFNEKMAKLMKGNCNGNIDKPNFNTRFNWVAIQKDYDSGIALRDLCIKHNCYTPVIFKAKREGLLKLRTKRESQKLAGQRHKGKKLTEETKRKISEGRKKFLRDNPDKHPWRKKDKFKSVPCQKVKDWLKEHNIEYIEEYQPLTDKFYSIDIAFPDKLIGIEINGNQHYNNDGTLKEYYQKRHDLIESAGWKLYEFHYSMCFKLDKISTIIPDILNSEKKVDFDYKVYIKPKKILKAKITEKQCTRKEKRIRLPVFNNCELCGCQKVKGAKRCMTCFRKSTIKSKIEFTKEWLEEQIKLKPMTEIGKIAGISDNGVKKWCKKLGVIIPNMRGYWAKRKSGMTHEESIKMKDVNGSP